MKNQETIQIIGCLETIDNWGREERHDAKDTYGILINPDCWTDDMRFYDVFNQCYFIDELIGQKVQVGPFIFTVVDDTDEELEKQNKALYS
jgi:hypothetical protein